MCVDKVVVIKWDKTGQKYFSMEDWLKAFSPIYNGYREKVEKGLRKLFGGE